MGIVFRQSFRNTIIIYTAFVIGGINTLFLYTRFLEDKQYGLVIFILSGANLLMPLMAFGSQYSIIKFYSSYTDTGQRERFLSFMLILPLIMGLLTGALGALFYGQIAGFLSQKNENIQGYLPYIYIIAVLTAYFELFYAWAKVQLQSVFGNFIREMFTRIAVMILLVLVYFKVLDFNGFLNALVLSYILRMLVMKLYAFKLHPPRLDFRFPANAREVLRYAFYIILAASAGSLLLDIDKVMIGGKLPLENTAFYTVALFIGSVIEAPGRAMSHIVQPLTSKAINEGNDGEIAALYKKSSMNLLLVSGLIYLLVNVNIQELYRILPPQYAGGTWVVWMISTAKLYHMFLGNNGAIISNSKYYRILLPYSVFSALSVVVLNVILINKIGINGAALATLLVVLVFNTLKIWFVKHKFGILPFTGKTVWLLLTLMLFFAGFKFWDFPFHPVVNIVLKSAVLAGLYLYVAVKLHFTGESLRVWRQVVSKVFPGKKT